MTARRRFLLVFLILVIGTGWTIGATNLPGAWYAGLQKPSFNPPNWVFAPAWTALYIMIAVAGWRTYLRDSKGVPMQIWFAQMLLNFLWSPVVFSLHRLALGLAIILTLLGTIVGFILMRWPEGPRCGGIIHSLRRLGGVRFAA